MRVKSIWILNHYAITQNFPGGTRHFDFGKELVKRGHKIPIFALVFGYSILKKYINVKTKNSSI